ETATLTVADTLDHVINNSESTAVSFTVAGIDDGGTGTVKIGRASCRDMVATATGHGTHTANLHSLNDGPSTSEPAFTDAERNTRCPPGNTLALGTYNPETATLTVADTLDHVINNSESTAVSFTVAGLDDGGTGTV